MRASGVIPRRTNECIFHTREHNNNAFVLLLPPEIILFSLQDIDLQRRCVVFYLRRRSDDGNVSAGILSRFSSLIVAHCSRVSFFAVALDQLAFTFRTAVARLLFY